ncbi:MAG TPA: hypothetical protein ENK91_09270 [Bacteroidetes bacterium]|nr:hypothetical protein [Bacteroidota bacterium]
MSTRLTSFSKILIVLVVMVVLFFLFKKFIPQNDQKSADATEIKTEKAKTNSETVKESKSSWNKSFNYTPTKPVNGKLKGVVELGASGFNSFIVNIDNNKNWELKKAEWGNSLVYDNMATSGDIREGLKRYITKILDYGVDGRDIHFVVSSGAQKVDNTKKIIRELKNMGYVVNTVTPEQEAKYALKAVLPKRYKATAFVVDIGSGNTKISWVENNGMTKGLETYGAKYYKNNVDDKAVYQDVFNKSKMIPKSRTEVCFMIGGVPFNLAKEVRKDKERYTVLKDPEDYNAEGAKIKAGLNIYKAIKDATGCDEYVFDWDANFTIGFLLGLK